MAIAFDSKTTAPSAASATSLTYSFTNTAGNYALFYGQDQVGASSLITGITYAASACSFVVGGQSATGDRYISIWEKNSPATGANNVVVSASGSTNLRWSAISYSGVATSSATNGTDTTLNQSAVSSISTDITTTTDNDWMFMFSKDGNGTKTYTSTTGDTVRLASDAAGHASADTGGAITPAGANTMTLQMNTGTANMGALAVAFKPAAAATTFVPRVGWFT